MKLTFETGWIEIKDLRDIPDDEQNYLVYCLYEDFLFPRPKKGSLIKKMFMAREATHFKKYSKIEKDLKHKCKMNRTLDALT